MLFKAIIVEDEIPQREELETMLQYAWPALEIIERCGDGLHAIDAITELKPDVVFVDVRIPGVNGIEVAKHAQRLGVHIVFTTAYDHYAVEAFNHRAIDYLLKPIVAHRLDECISRLKTLLTSSENTQRSPIIGHLQGIEYSKNGGKKEPLSWIMAGIGDAIKMVPTDDVLFFQSQDKYTRVVTASMDTHIRTPLKEISDGMDEQKFWLIHRNAIVKVDAIEKISRDDAGRMWVHVKGKTDKLAVSSAHQGRFRAM
jgi:DNA-binding LytR/AlgR family response regulator